MKSTLQKTISAIREGRFDVAAVGIFKLLANPLFFAWVAVSLWLLTKMDFSPEPAVIPRTTLSFVYLINGIACGAALLIRGVFLLMRLLDSWDQMDQKYQDYQPLITVNKGFTLEEYDPFGQVFDSKPVTAADMLTHDSYGEDDGFVFEDDFFDDRDINYESLDDFFGEDGDEKPESRFD